MNTKNDIETLLSEKVLAVAGVSRNKNKFGNQIYKDLKKKGYTVYPVNPYLLDFDGDKCYKSISEIPEVPGSVVVCVNKNSSYEISVDAFNSGVKNIWFQTGSESDRAIEYCSGKNMNVISGECILMFAKPEGFHNFHRWVNGLFGKLPA